MSADMDAKGLAGELRAWPKKSLNLGEGAEALMLRAADFLDALPGQEQKQEDSVSRSCPVGQLDRAATREAELTADFVRGLPGGKFDDSDYEAIESALDRADAPMKGDGRWLTLAERIAALAAVRDSLGSSFAESNREIRRIQAEADAAIAKAESGLSGGGPSQSATGQLRDDPNA